jgi:uncharacterized cupin superfamily protein
VFVLNCEVPLVHDAGETILKAGMCVGFPRKGTAHHLVNRSAADATYLEVGDRQTNDIAEYPRDDLVAERTHDGRWRFTRKNGAPY